jgi:alkyl hydroperoxide reductase subunit AhpC
MQGKAVRGRRAQSESGTAPVGRTHLRSSGARFRDPLTAGTAPSDSAQKGFLRPAQPRVIHPAAGCTAGTFGAFVALPLARTGTGAISGGSVSPAIFHATNEPTRRCAMALQIGETAPDFEAQTTEGKIRFHDWVGDSWAVLFSHPKDFTPVCTTELGYMARIKPEFDKRGVKIIGLSVDPVENHAKWADDIKETQGFAPNYPMIGDTDLSIAKAWGMLPASAGDDASKRTAMDNQTVRNVFVIGPDKKIKLVLVYPMTTGRNFDEVLRVIDSLQLTAKHKVATPAQWKQGDDVIIAGSVSDDDARKTYPQGWKSPKPYIRIVPQPGR